MRDLKTISLLLILSFLALGLVHPVSADENVANGSYVIVSSPDSIYNQSTFNQPPPTYRITQGQTVYLNDTIDISGMGWGTGVAWYGKYGEYDIPAYIRDFKNYHSDLFNFYVDPIIFSGKGGMWYQYYGNATEKNGNLAAFFVREGYRNSTLTFPNGTTVNESYAVRGNGTPLVIPQTSILPEVHEADYLLAIGDPLILKSYGPAQVWIFGRINQNFGSTDNDNMTFPASDFYNFEPGAYSLIIQHGGNNTQCDVRYHNGTIQYQDGWNGVKTVDASALQPRMIEQQLKTLLAKTDDTYTEYTLQVQEPLITITSMDEVWLKSKMLEFHIDNTADVTFKDVRGYTNLQNSTNITVVLDNKYFSGNTPGRITTYAQTWRTNQGNRTMFRAYIPIVWDTIPLGMHTITASGPFGAYVDANFAVELLPPDSYRPNTTLKYTTDANPWKPNLTIPAPVIVTQIVPGPVVTVIVTPSNEQVKAQQDAIASEHEAFWAKVIAGLVVLVVGGKYLYSVIRRWRLQKHD